MPRHHPRRDNVIDRGHGLVARYSDEYPKKLAAVSTLGLHPHGALLLPNFKRLHLNMTEAGTCGIAAQDVRIRTVPECNGGDHPSSAQFGRNVILRRVALYDFFAAFLAH